MELKRFERKVKLRRAYYYTATGLLSFFPFIFFTIEKIRLDYFIYSILVSFCGYLMFYFLPKIKSINYTKYEMDNFYNKYLH